MSSTIIEPAKARVLELNLAGTGMMSMSDGRPFAWRPADLSPPDWTIGLGVREIEEAVELGPAALRPAMRLVKEKLESGTGFAIIDRLPVSRMSEKEAIHLYAWLGSMLGRQVPTKFDGTLFYRVTDEGRPFGPGVRGSATSSDSSIWT